MGIQKRQAHDHEGRCSDMTTGSRVAAAPLYSVLPAKDIDRARDFWENKVGMEFESPAHGYLMGKAGGGTRFTIYETALAPTQATTAAIVVDDLDAAMAELRERGVEFQDYDMPGMKTVNGVADFGAGMGRGAWFVDSEGNTINVVQM
jgi:predicted enzyme related to lactoylglutathione lyase